MNSSPWKEILLKEKEYCNQLVLTVKRTNSKFSEEELANHMEPFFNAVTSNHSILFEEKTVLSLFETFVILISKQFFQRIEALDSLFFQIILEIHPDLKKDPNLLITYIVNVISKLEDGKKEIFLKRLQSVLLWIQTISEFKLVISLLFWASGKPEYRESLQLEFHTLNEGLKKEIKRLFGIDENSIRTAFITFDPNQKSKASFHFRFIPGYTLFGGSFSHLPILYQNGGSIAIQSGKSWYELFIDEFGTSLHTMEPIKSPVKINNSIKSSIWKQIVSQKLETNSISSSIETDSFVVLTLKNSYQLYLFYTGRT
ncbi:hypothetical protein [Leptospira bouyouniensis]|uniref:TLDc domain-containing protein n=1 Tax=Leptospira bouyouniensis TaxID=2484911 RepID=A0ABY2L8U8_9LEPT|nr:hypothetical protein [Leptospira bouyouniensis]TGK52670.1 hypothetical protein EHQ10_02660 [Leptospira bouyouniensis]